MSTNPIYFYLFVSPNNRQWYFNIRSVGNHKIIAQSEGYLQRTDAQHAINLIRNGAGKAQIYDETSKSWAA